MQPTICLQHWSFGWQWWWLHQQTHKQNKGKWNLDLAKQHHEPSKQVSVVQVSCHLLPSLWLWDMDPACWLRKRSSLSEPSARGESLRLSYLEHKTNGWCGARSTSLWVHRNLFWQLSKRRKPVGDAVVHRGKAGWTTSKSGHPCPCRNDWKRISAKSSIMSYWWPDWLRDWTELYSNNLQHKKIYTHTHTFHTHVGVCMHTWTWVHTPIYTCIHTRPTTHTCSTHTDNASFWNQYCEYKKTVQATETENKDSIHLHR